ncbi:MAG: glucuronate isomerase [Prevotella sp.]|nr:glucuronate isomerase [Prevotella sp.]
MKTFMDDNFLLQTTTAQRLYHEHAKHLPIIDYHCHLSPQEVADDHRFRSITELWLGGDHYKWRAMRANGVAERFITGDTTDWEKFEKWAETMPYAMRNPLYHWTHLELRTAFGIDKILSPATAREIYDECNEKLKSPEYSARGLMRRYQVEVVCTTDDPVDSLEYHRKLAQETAGQPAEGPKDNNPPGTLKMFPAWRPDKAMAIENPKTYQEYIGKLSVASGIQIKTYQDLIEALALRHDFFAEQGCSISDHGIDRFYSDDYRPQDPCDIFDRVMDGEQPDDEDISLFRSAMLYEQAVSDARAGWVQQYHYGPIRNNNTKMFRLIGPDTGYDSMGDVNTARPMACFFDNLAQEDLLAKTIIYNINPKDNDMVATMIGNYQDGSMPGKMQWGSGWWFADQKDGIEKQLNTLSLQGLLSRFVGMLTDSRSFLSYPRHEYFRRVLCNLIGNDIEQGLLPMSEISRIEQMVEDICYYNAKRYFNF